jgi:hypothetical protein
LFTQPSVGILMIQDHVLGKLPDIRRNFLGEGPDLLEQGLNVARQASASLFSFPPVS